MKKILSTILIITMLLSTAAMLVFPTSLTVSAEPYTPEGTGISSLSEIKSGTAGNPNKYFLTKDIILDSSYVSNTQIDYFVLDGKDTNGVQHKIHFDNALYSAFTCSTSPEIKNLTLTGNITYSGDSNHISPLFRSWVNDPKLTNITSSVNITTGKLLEQSVGGIAAWITDHGGMQLENLEYSGTITLNHYAKSTGGMAGIVEAINTSGNFSGYIKNCTNKGKFVINSTDYISRNADNSIGGMVGNIWSTGGGITIEGCVNNATLTQITGATWVNRENRGIGGIVGILNAYLACKVKDCVNYMGFSIEHGMSFAGIVGNLCYGNHTVENCQNHGDFTVSKTARNAGGIVALILRGKITIKDCTNYGDIYYKSTTRLVNHEATGGILGRIWHNSGSTGTPGNYTPTYEVVLQNCTNLGNITFEDGVRTNETDNSGNEKFDYHVGGVAGRAYATESVRINRCANYGNVSVPSTTYGGGWREAGGILGALMTSMGTMHLQITNSHNKGNITSKYAGGILGATYQLNSVATPANSSTVWGPDKIKIEISYCSNSGTLTGTHDKTWTTGSSWRGSQGDAGGIIAGMDQGGCPGGDLWITSCVNEGTVQGGRFAGGILAVRSPNTVDVCNNTGTEANPIYSASNYTSKTVDPGKTYIDNCVNNGTVETKSGADYYAAAGIVSSAKGYFHITNSISNGNLIALDDGSDGWLTVPIACAHENTWGYTASTTTTNGNIFTGNAYGGISAVNNNYSHYTALPNATAGSLVNAHPYSVSDAAPYVAAKIKTCFTGEVVSDLDPGIANQTIVVTDARQFNQYDIGARNFVLGTDITVKSGMGYSKDFNGVTFDGAGYTVTLESNTAATLFGDVLNSTFRNVKLAGSDLAYGETSGPLARTVAGNTLIEDVTSSATVNAGGSSTSKAHLAFGGIVGQIGKEGTTSNVTVKNCTFDGTITANKGDSYKQRCTGGLIGHVYMGTASDNVTVEGCINNGKVTATRGGGIVCGVCLDGIAHESDTAFHNAKVNITDCVNNGDVDCHQNAGGIIADPNNRITLAIMNGKNATSGSQDFMKAPLPNVTVDGCLNTGDVSVVSTIGYTSGDGYGHNNAAAASGGIVAIADRVTVLNCINTGYVKSENSSHTDGSIRPVGGIFGWKPNESYEVTCGKAADGSLNGLYVENCKNAGRVEGYTAGIGGIVGTVWVGSATIKRCVNTGYVVSTTETALGYAIAAAGILGLLNSWESSQNSSVGTNNIDAVYEGSFRQWSYEESAAAGIGVVIDGCVNAGKIEMKCPALRDADVWKMISGIAGPCKTGIKIVNCVHTGELEDNADWYNSTFPIANPLEAWAAYYARDWDESAVGDTMKYTLRPPVVDYYGETDPITGKVIPSNYYTTGSVDHVLTTSTYQLTGQERRTHYGEEMYQYSTEASAEQVRILMQEMDVYAFDRTSGLEEQVEFAKWIKDPAGVVDGKWRGLEYTDAQKATIEAEIANSETLMAEKETTISSSVEGYVSSVNLEALNRRQNTVYDQETTLRKAIMAYQNEDAVFEVIIPEKLPTNAEVVVLADLTNFAYYDGLRVTMQSVSGNKLTHEDDPNVTIDYTVWFEGDKNHLLFARDKTLDEIMADPQGQLIYNATGDDAMKRSMILLVDKETNKDKPDGIYKDEVTFTVEKISLENQ